MCSEDDASLTSKLHFWLGAGRMYLTELLNKDTQNCEPFSEVNSLKTLTDIAIQITNICMVYKKICNVQCLDGSSISIIAQVIVNTIKKTHGFYHN